MRGLDATAGQTTTAPADVGAGGMASGKGVTGAPPEHGTMISMSVPYRIAKRLAVPGGEAPEHMHVTLAYLGKGLSPAQLSDAHRAVKCFAREYSSPIAAKLAGLGRFSASETSDGRDVYHATVDAPALPAARQQIVDCLKQLGVPVAMNHGFHPHVTLAYLHPDAPIPAHRMDPIEMQCHGLNVVTGNVRGAFYPFGDFRPPALVAKALAPAEGAAADALRYVLGIVLEPDGVDGQGDTISADEIRKTAWDWMQQWQLNDLQHSFVPSQDVVTVESWLAPIDMTINGRKIRAGTWLVGAILSPLRWAEARAGKWTGWSIGGRGDRERLTA